MERFNALGRGAQIMLVGGVLLFIDLFLPWQDFGGGIADELGIDATFSGWRGVGAVLGILTIILVAWLAVRLAAVDLPIPVSTAMISALLGGLVLIFGVIKWITIIDDEATIWAWIGLVLTLAIAAGAWLAVQAAGGIATLKSELPTKPVSSTSEAPPPAATAPPPPAAPEAAPSEPEAASDKPSTERET
jgi:hypothetical protein